MIVFVLTNIWCALCSVTQHTLLIIIVETAERTIVDARVILLIPSHMHINYSVLHLSILMHFILH